MQKLLRAFLNFFLYSSLNISIAASLFCIETFFLINVPFDLHLIGFTFFATLCLYSIHRIVGIRKMSSFTKMGRYKVIEDFKWHIIVYCLIGFLVSSYCFFSLQSFQQMLIIILALISVAYALPLFSRKRRLRDFNYVKIFLIAIVWALLCGYLPISLNDWDSKYALIIAEKFLFILAVTIPFDIRDMEYDEEINVKTLPHKFGMRGSKYLASTLLIVALLLSLFSMLLFPTQLSYVIGSFTMYGMAFILILLCNSQRPDWYFSGFMDGVIGLRAIICLIFYYII